MQKTVEELSNEIRQDALAALQRLAAEHREVGMDVFAAHVRESLRGMLHARFEELDDAWYTQVLEQFVQFGERRMSVDFDAIANAIAERLPLEFFTPAPDTDPAPPAGA